MERYANGILRRSISLENLVEMARIVTCKTDGKKGVLRSLIPGSDKGKTAAGMKVESTAGAAMAE